MNKSRILAAATIGAALALGPTSAAFAGNGDVGPIDETGGYGPQTPAKKVGPPEGKVKEQSTPRTSSTPQKPAAPAVPQKPVAPQTPKTTTVPATPKKREVPATPKKPDVAIGEASFFAKGESVVPVKPAVDAGRVSQKDTKPQVPAEGKVAAQHVDTPPKAVESPRETVIKVTSTPEQKVTKQGFPGRTGEQLPAGAPRTGFGSSAGLGLDSVSVAAGGAALLAGCAMAGFGVARRRQVVAFRG